MNSQTPIVSDLVLVGGGHSHIAVLRSLGMKPMPGVRVTLIGREVDTPYSGMLPGLIAGHYSFDDAHIDLARLCGFAGARFIHAAAAGIDVGGKRVVFGSRPSLAYDVLSINTGSAPNTELVPGAREFATPVKPIDQFYQRWLAIKADAKRRSELRICVVGGGAGGVELALAAEFALRESAAQVHVTLISADNNPPTGHHKRVQDKLQSILGERGVALELGTKVTEVKSGEVVLQDGRAISADEIFWVTQAGAPTWPSEAGLATDERGFILVNDFLQSVTDPSVFAAGDIATMENHPRAKSGVMAVRQGPPLSENLRRQLCGEKLRAFSPQKKFLALIGTGDGQAVASRGRIATSGPALWQLKDQIDRRFMAKYHDLPEMQATPPPPPADGLADADKLRRLAKLNMRCSGCGSKVGKSVLSRALAKLEPRDAEGLIVGLGDADDAAVTDIGGGRVMVQTVDGFPAIVSDPYTFGRIAATHALSDIFAMGADAHTALAWATLPIGLEEKVESDLDQLMAGADRALAEAGCALAGGHTSEGNEMALGLAITGFGAKDQVLTKGGLVPGQVLVATKAIGVGALFAAHMRGKAKGRWLSAAIATMLLSNRRGAEILRDFGARAVTDITGFGLIGHLFEMLDASQCGATLQIENVPLLAGALQVTEAGITSSLTPDNLRLRRTIENAESAANHPAFPLLFDPQTSGGLLGAVPADAANECVLALRNAGYAYSAAIGTVIGDHASIQIVL